MNLSDKIVYLIADRSNQDFAVFLGKIRSALDGGITLLQYRNKTGSGRVMFEEAARFAELCRQYKASLIINDRPDIALCVNAEGVHVGRDDLPLREVRRLLGNEKIAGATAKSVEQAREAQSQGASYIGTGALFKSPTKPDAIPIDINTLKEIRKCVRIPVFGIGGITLDNINAEIMEYIDGVAVASAVLDSDNPERAARDLYKKINAF